MKSKLYTAILLLSASLSLGAQNKPQILPKAAIPTAWSVCLKYDYSTSKYSHIGNEDIAKESLDIADAIIKQLKESEVAK